MGTQHITDGAKCQDSCEECDDYGGTDDHCEFLEEDEVAAEEEGAATECGDATTEYADAHFSEGLSHLFLSCLVL